MTTKEIVNHYGKDTSLTICIEELSELIHVLCKIKRGFAHGDNLAEEMADVQIIMRWLEIIFNNSDEVSKWKDKKFQRLFERIRGDVNDLRNLQS
jgi:hypothetical protein